MNLAIEPFHKFWLKGYQQAEGSLFTTKSRGAQSRSDFSIANENINNFVFKP